MTSGLTHQQVLRGWLLTTLGEHRGSMPTKQAHERMEERYGSALSEADWNLTDRGDEHTWWNRTRYERKNMEREGLLVSARQSRGIWTLTEAGWEELRRLRAADVVPEPAEVVSTPSPDGPATEPRGREAPHRAETTTQRIVRSTAVADYVKRLHAYTCQVCGTRIATPGGAYAEAAHIQALGQPHSGPDVAANVLCLCPNHHVLFDFGMLSISDDLMVTDHASGARNQRLREVPEHRIGREYLTYHRNCHRRA
ncbi:MULTISPECIES: HNH endonuclease [unclassified Streptomyces]|uniref:HNH endonuclease n=1 Tax=unclassified Streptomyces TaxID=2593676 RepID=UPI00093BE545|nr:HNH endonuclease [Streptomyces sp. CB02058]